MTTTKAPWGARDVEVPEGATAWGARLLITLGGENGCRLHPGRDRMGTNGGEHGKELMDHLDEVLPPKTLERRVCDAFGQECTRSQETKVLHDDDSVIVHGSPQGSNGYFYVTAIWKSRDTKAKRERTVLTARRDGQLAWACSCGKFSRQRFGTLAACESDARAHRHTHRAAKS